jgi:hypothetical protein
MPASDATTGELLSELIAVLAAALEDDHRRAEAARHAPRPARIAAADVARCVTARDYAGASMLLARQRTQQEWQQLAIALAGLADPVKTARADTRLHLRAA